jgi:fatty acid desaturase
MQKAFAPKVESARATPTERLRAKVLQMAETVLAIAIAWALGGAGGCVVILLGWVFYSLVRGL